MGISSDRLTGRHFVNGRKEKRKENGVELVYLLWSFCCGDDISEFYLQVDEEITPQPSPDRHSHARIPNHEGEEEEKEGR